MSSNPINLALRFLLEIAALVAMGYWGWTQHAGVRRWLLVIGVPLVAAAIWGVFRVPNDPGTPPIQVSGFVRFAIEMAFFGLAAYCLFAAERQMLAFMFAGVVLLHYLISYDRVVWLFSQ